MKMSKFAIPAIVGLAALPLALSPAKAQAVLGTVSLQGTDVTNLPADTIAFNPFGANGIPVGAAQITVATGVLAPVFPVATNVGMIGGGTAVNWTTPGAWVGQNLFGSTPEDFRISTFVPGPAAPAGGALDLSGTGLFMGAVNLPGTWTLTTQVGPPGFPNTTTFSAQVLAVPGPIVGAGLPGLIAALGGLVAMARRRRNQLA